MKKTNLIYLAAGLVLFAASSLVLTQSGHHFNAHQITRLWAANWLGLIFLSEFICRHFGNTSLLNWIFRNWRNLLGFILVASLGGVMIEGIGQWLCKLWYYPFFTPQQYRHAAAGGFALYMTTITEVYLAAKMIFDRLLVRRRLDLKPTAAERQLFPFFLWLSLLLMFIFVALCYRRYQSRGGYFFNVLDPVSFHISFWTLVLLPLGIWLACEYWLFRRGEASFLRGLIRHYWSPVIAIFGATAVVGISMELINLRYGYWVYANWPLQSTKLFRLPVVMIALAWPIQFVMWLSLLRLLLGRKFINVWSASDNQR